MELLGGDSEIATYLFIRTDNHQPSTVNEKSRFLAALEMTRKGVRNDGEVWSQWRGRVVEMIGNEDYDFVLF